MNKTYSQKLKDPQWQKKRLEVLSRDRFTCRVCECDTKTLHVHHFKYDGSNPWETNTSDLTTLCEDCHDLIHKVEKTGSVGVAMLLISLHQNDPEMVDVFREHITQLIKDHF
jgi:hypothetical protein